MIGLCCGVVWVVTQGDKYPVVSFCHLLCCLAKNPKPLPWPYPSGGQKYGRYLHRRMGTLWLGGAEGLICPKFYTDNHKHPPPPWTLPAWRHPPSQNLKNTPTLGHSQAPPPLGHCLCDVIIHIPKGLICSFLWPIFSSCFARISPTVCPNLGGQLPPPPCPPASYAYGYLVRSLRVTVVSWMTQPFVRTCWVHISYCITIWEQGRPLATIIRQRQCNIDIVL